MTKHHKPSFYEGLIMGIILVILGSLFVNRAVEKLGYFIERIDLNQLIHQHVGDISLPRLPILLKLKKGSSEDKILRFLRIKL